MRIMALAYTSLTNVSIFAFVLVAVFCSRRAAEEFLFLFVLLALSASLIGIFVPAYGTMVHLHGAVAGMENIRQFGVAHVPYFDHLRTAGMHVLTMEDLPGLTTFPSFHTAMGVILIYVTRERPGLFVPTTVYGILMIMSTPIFGSHYFVDLIAGAALTVAGIIATRAYWPFMADQVPATAQSD